MKIDDDGRARSGATDSAAAKKGEKGRAKGHGERIQGALVQLDFIYTLFFLVFLYVCVEPQSVWRAKSSTCDREGYVTVVMDLRFRAVKLIEIVDQRVQPFFQRIFSLNQISSMGSFGIYIGSSYSKPCSGAIPSCSPEIGFIVLFFSWICSKGFYSLKLFAVQITKNSRFFLYRELMTISTAIDCSVSRIERQYRV